MKIASGAHHYNSIVKYKYSKLSMRLTLCRIWMLLIFVWTLLNLNAVDFIVLLYARENV